MHNFLLILSPLWTKQIISDISLYFWNQVLESHLYTENTVFWNWAWSSLTYFIGFKFFFKNSFSAHYQQKRDENTFQQWIFFHGGGWTTLNFCDQPYILPTWCPLTFFTCCSGVNTSQLVHPVFPHVILVSTTQLSWSHTQGKAWSVIHTSTRFNWMYFSCYYCFLGKSVAHFG